MFGLQKQQKGGLPQYKDKMKLTTPNGEPHRLVNHSGMSLQLETFRILENLDLSGGEVSLEVSEVRGFLDGLM